MITYDSFLRSIKIKSITGEKSNSLIEFLISVRDNGSYDLCKLYDDDGVSECHYEYRYKGVAVFTFKYKYYSYDCEVRSNFIVAFDKKYSEVYDDCGYANNSISKTFFSRYIREFLAYDDFIKELEVVEK